MVDVAWPVAKSGYKWKPLHFPGETAGLEAVKRWPVREYDPLNGHTGLFLAFSNLKDDKDSIKNFADQYGLLGVAVEDQNRQETATDHRPYFAGTSASRGLTSPQDLFRLDPHQGRYRAEGFSIWKSEIKLMKQCVKTWRNSQKGKTSESEIRDFQGIVDLQLYGSASPRLVDTKRGLSLEIYPLSLRGVLWFQLAQAIAENAEFRECGACGKLFKLSPKTARTNRKFCSEACRSSAYRGRRRAKAQQLAAAGKSPEEIASELRIDVKMVHGFLKQEEE